MKQNTKSMKDKIKLSAFQIDAPEIPVLNELTRTGYDYISYGSDNKFPDYLYELYLNSSILQSIINGTGDYVIGDGIITDDKFKAAIKKAVIDYLIFGGFALQLYFKNGIVEKIDWLDFRNCRTNEDETKIFYSNKWGQYGKKCLEYKKYDGTQKSGTCIYYYKGIKTRGVYPIPMYVGALKSVKISTEISNFHYNNILSGFNSNFIINMNNGIPDEETQGKIEKMITDKFCGTDNAGKFMLSFNDNKESAVSVERIQDDDFDEKYQSLAKFVREDIFIAFRATPNLFGLMNETTGFNSQEFAESFKLYNKTVVSPIQEEFKTCFAEFGVNIDFEEFKLFNENKE